MKRDLLAVCSAKRLDAIIDWSYTYTLVVPLLAMLGLREDENSLALLSEQISGIHDPVRTYGFHPHHQAFHHSIHGFLAVSGLMNLRSRMVTGSDVALMHHSRAIRLGELRLFEADMLGNQGHGYRTS